MSQPDNPEVPTGPAPADAGLPGAGPAVPPAAPDPSEEPTAPDGPALVTGDVVASVDESGPVGAEPAEEAPVAEEAPAVAAFEEAPVAEEAPAVAAAPAVEEAPAVAPSRARRRATIAVLAFSVFVSMIHQAGPTFQWVDGWPYFKAWRLWEWFIEDAAITFAYARNWAMGDGLVAFPGSERIEGYSNPTWTALIALIHWATGIDGFVSSKWMGMIFGGATVILTWLLAKEVVDDERSPAPLLAPLVLAFTPTFAFWNASGLENPLFNFFLAGALWRTVVEGKRGGFPWASLWFLGLACTRPEGIMYGAWGGFVAMVWALAAGRGLVPTLKWLAAFFVPFFAYQAVRYSYFAWELPNTYYAKLGEKDFRPFAWSGRGWKQIREWAYDTGLGWFVPVHLAGLVGLRGARRWFHPVLVLVLAFLVLYPDTPITRQWSWWPTNPPTPEWWTNGRVWGLLAFVLAAPLTTLGDRRAWGRVLCWGSACLTLFFSVYSGGDWMRGYRWFSLLVVPASVLFAVGVGEIAEAIERPLRRFFSGARAGWGPAGWVVATVLCLALLPKFYEHSEFFFGKRETGPFSVRRRVEYTQYLMDRLFRVDEHIYNLDVDMGAHLYWSTHEMVDMAGLVDVVKAHHNWTQRSFIQEYVFQERKPQVAHVHGGWANTSKIPTYAEWKRDYVEVPGFPAGRTTNHVGNHVRRDLFMSTTWTGTPGREVYFDDGIVLVGFEVPSPEISQGKALYLEVGVQYRRLDGKEDFRVLAFLSDDAGRVHAFDVPVGYDWLPPKEWRVGEINTVRLAPPTDGDLPPGVYDLGFVVVGEDGRVIEPARQEGKRDFLPLPEGVVVGGHGGVPARFARGEVRFPAVVRIGEPGTGELAAKLDYELALELARGGDCAGATAQWRLAWLHLPRAERWRETHRPAFADAVATCFAEAARAEDDLFVAADHLFSARIWNHRLPVIWEVADRVGDQLYQRGLAARAEEDWKAAYRAFAAAVRAKPTLSWARRYAEEARDKRLGIDDASVEAAKAARAARAARLARPTGEAEAEAD